MKFRMSSLVQDIKENLMADLKAKLTPSARPDIQHIQPAEKPPKKEGNGSAAASYERYIAGTSQRDYPPEEFLG